MTPETSSQPPSARPGRSCFGCVVTSSLGCSGLVVGALGAVVLFAPTMLELPLAGIVENSLDSSVQGRITVDKVEFGWSSPITLEGLSILGEDESLIAKLDLVLPSLAVLADEWAPAWDMTANVESLNLVFQQDGSTNLERALAPSSQATKKTIEIGGVESDEGLLDAVDYDIFLNMDTNAWSISTENCLQSFGMVGGGGTFSRSGEETKISFLRDGPSASLVVDLVWTGGSVPEGKVRARPVPVEMIGQALMLDGDLGQNIGDLVSLEVDLVDRGVNVTMWGTEGRQIRLDGEVVVGEGGTSVRGGRGGLTGNATLSSNLLPFSDADLPVGTRLNVEAEPWTFSTADAWSIQLEPEEGIELMGSLDLNRDEPVALVKNVGSEEHRLMALEKPLLNLSRDVTGVRGSLVSEHAGVKWQREQEEDLWRWEVAIEGLETRVFSEVIGFNEASLSTYAPVAHLGERIDLLIEGTELEGAIELSSSAEVPNRASMSAHYKPGWFHGLEGDVIQIPLDPSSSHDRTWLADLLPWYGSLTKVEGSDPVWIRLTEFDMPFSWNLSEFRARADLDLGEVQFEHIESFASLFTTGLANAGIETFGPVQLELDGEMVRYGDGLEIAIGGELFPFTGSHDLRRDLIYLSGEVLGVFVLGANTTEMRGIEIPVTLHGPVEQLALNIELNSMRTELTEKVNSVFDLLRKEDD